MGKTSERLEAYQTQMSIYAEQHKLILASDVLDMIEQLQDDLKDDIEKVVAELEGYQSKYTQCRFDDDFESGLFDGCEYAIEVVRKGGVE